MVRFLFAYTLYMGEMKRAIAREEDRGMTNRFLSTIAICASIIAAVRLARDENLSTPTPRLMTVVADSIALAKLILGRIIR